MDNRAFDDSDVKYYNSSVSSLSVPEKQQQPSQLQTKTNWPSIITMVDQESVPFNVTRPILYTANFYPSLQTEKSNLTHHVSGPNCSSSETNFNKPCQPQTIQRVLIRRRLHSKCKSWCSVQSLLPSVFPILTWLPRYNVRSNLLADVITGFTILAFHIPQGLAYGRLAGVDAINGLYVSLFPGIVYAVFGGSHQISVGTFAVICIACKDALDSLANQGIVIYEANQQQLHNISASNVSISTASPIEALTSLCLLVGLIQFGLGFLRLGFVATLMSDPITSAFVVACSLYVFTSQVFALFGVSSKRLENETHVPFELIGDWIHVITRIPSSNLATVFISAGTITTLVICKKVLEPYLVERFRLKHVTIPIDLIMIATFSGATHWFDLKSRFGVDTVPKFTAGFHEMPVLPRLDLWPYLVNWAVLIAFIAYTSSYSLSKIFAHKHGYEVYPNQELVALGLSNAISSFLLCFPSTGSLARSVVQEKVGGKTQLASLLSSVLIVIFILFFSHFLETLPNCVLSCIIVVALMSTLKAFTELPHFWRISKLDGTLWLLTFILVVLFGVGNGLFYALIVGLIFLTVRIAMPEFNLKYRVSDSECYLTANWDFDQHQPTQYLNTPGALVFELHGPFIFLNVERFKHYFDELILKPIGLQQLHAQVCQSLAISPKPNKQPVNTSIPTCLPTEIGTRVVVFDMSRVSYLDSKAVELLSQLIGTLKKLKVNLVLASPSEHVVDCLIACGFFKDFDSKNCFLTVHDAIMAHNSLLLNI